MCVTFIIKPKKGAYVYLYKVSSLNIPLCIRGVIHSFCFLKVFMKKLIKINSVIDSSLIRV